MKVFDKKKTSDGSLAGIKKKKKKILTLSLPPPHWRVEKCSGRGRRPVINGSGRKKSKFGEKCWACHECHIILTHFITYFLILLFPVSTLNYFLLKSWLKVFINNKRLSFFFLFFFLTNHSNHEIEWKNFFSVFFSEKKN